MSDTNVAARHGEGFEQYVERQFHSIHERLSNMESSIAGLAADTDALAQAVPAIANALNDLHAALATEEGRLNDEIAKEGQDAETIARLEGELAQVTAIAEKLHPVAQQANSLIAAPAGGEAAPAGEPPAPLPGESAHGEGSAGVGEGGV